MPLGSRSILLLLLSLVAIANALPEAYALGPGLLRRFFGVSGVQRLSVSGDGTDSPHALKSAFDKHFLLPEDFYLASISPVAVPTEAELDAIQNENFFEGDIAGIPLDGGSVRLADAPYDVFSEPLHSSLNLATYPDKLWEGARIPYMLEEGMTEGQRAAIAQAFDEYKEKTCVRFVPREDSDFDYIYIKRNQAFGCSSYVGRAGGNQTISLEVGKCFTKGIIAHELMHALGFFHEHSRTDRDQFVDILEENIRPGMLRNFELYPRKIIDPLGMPYDYGSVMHYHTLAFSRNGKPTIVPREDGVEIGQRYKLSDIDARKVNKLYQCGDFGSTTTSPSTTTTTTTTTTTPSTTTTTKSPATGPTNRWTRPTTTSTTTTTTTTTEPTTTTTLFPETSTNPDKKCEDLNAHCDMWEQLGHCKHSAKYMGHYCRKSCKMCSTEPVSAIRPSGGAGRCLDKNLFCGYWAKIGECKSESKFMKIFCKRSCGECDPADE
uniref:Metalloendopeptidase n=1 Tax=Plectus sambesii TaxID=2011161 RepID=A0A914VE07_9BILA